MAWDIPDPIDRYGPWYAHSVEANGSTGTEVDDYPVWATFDGATDVEDELRAENLRLEARLAAEQVKRERAEAEAEVAQDQTAECERLRAQVAELRPAALAFYKLQRQIQAQLLLPNTAPEERHAWEHWTTDLGKWQN